MMNLIWAITGGRPMTHLMDAFPDVVGGGMVGFYRDKFGRVWLADGPWSSTRVYGENSYRFQSQLYPTLNHEV